MQPILVSDVVNLELLNHNKPPVLSLVV